MFVFEANLRVEVMDPAGVAPALVTDMGGPKSEDPAPLTSLKTTAASKTMLNADVARPNIAAQPLSFSSVVFNETTLRGRQLLEKGKKSWLKTGEVLELLENYDKYLLRVSSFAPFLPKGANDISKALPAVFLTTIASNVCPSEAWRREEELPYRYVIVSGPNSDDMHASHAHTNHQGVTCSS